MNKEIRKALLAESLGYWRKTRQTEFEGNGESIAMLMFIAAKYAQGGTVGFNTACHLTNCNPRYQQAILETVQQLLGEIE